MKKTFVVMLCGLMMATFLAGQSAADPGPDPGGPYGGPDTYEATMIDFTATVDDPAFILFRWDLDNDGEWDTPWRLSLTMSDGISRLYGDDYHGVIVVDIWDGISTTTIVVDGVRVVVPLTESYTAELEVNNAPPVVSSDGPDSGWIGKPMAFVAYAEDPGSDDLTFTWDWGDGSSESCVHFNNGVGPDPTRSTDLNPTSVADERTHGYEAAGTYAITVTVTDDDGGSTTITRTVTVLGPDGAMDNLMGYVEAQEIPKGTKTSLLAHLENARRSLAKGNEDAAAQMLEVFAHHAGVLREAGKLTQDQADRMASSAQAIIENIADF